MFPDNNLLVTSIPHIVEPDFLPFSHSRGSGTTSPFLDSPDSFKPPPFAMFNTHPVAFPPSDVPLEYVRHKLQREAQDFWGNVETTDCTITIPLPFRASERSPSPSPVERDNSIPVGPFTNHHTPSGSNRRATQPALNDWPRLVLHLHSIFLLSSSSFLRGLLSGASPLDLIHTTPHAEAEGASHLFTGQFTHPANHIPRLLPCSPDHPSIYLPVPDPQSIQAIMYWIYWGNTKYIEQCLHNGSIQWEGLSKNAEYLGLPTELKIFLAQWRRLCLSPDHSPYTSDEESDTLISDSEDDTSSTVSDSDVSWDMDDEKAPRGRSTMTRPLHFQQERRCYD